MTSKKASDFYKNLLDENEDIIFDTKTQNGNSVKYELALLEKKGNQLFPIYTKDEYGRNVKLEFDCLQIDEINEKGTPWGALSF